MTALTFIAKQTRFNMVFQLILYQLFSSYDRLDPLKGKTAAMRDRGRELLPFPSPSSAPLLAQRRKTVIKIKSRMSGGRTSEVRPFARRFAEGAPRARGGQGAFQSEVCL